MQCQIDWSQAVPCMAMESKERGEEPGMPFTCDDVTQTSSCRPQSSHIQLLHVFGTWNSELLVLACWSEKKDQAMQQMTLVGPCRQILTTGQSGMSTLLVIFSLLIYCCPKIRTLQLWCNRWVCDLYVLWHHKQSVPGSPLLSFCCWTGGSLGARLDIRLVFICTSQSYFSLYW